MATGVALAVDGNTFMYSRFGLGTSHRAGRGQRGTRWGKHRLAPDCGIRTHGLFGDMVYIYSGDETMAGQLNKADGAAAWQTGSTAQQFSNVLGCHGPGHRIADCGSGFRLGRGAGLFVKAALTAGAASVVGKRPGSPRWPIVSDVTKRARLIFR